MIRTFAFEAAFEERSATGASVVVMDKVAVRLDQTRRVPDEEMPSVGLMLKKNTVSGCQR